LGKFGEGYGWGCIVSYGDWSIVNEFVNTAWKVSVMSQVVRIWLTEHIDLRSVSSGSRDPQMDAIGGRRCPAISLL